MRIPSRARQYGSQFNMTPMIDIVFLLLIFFLIASYLSNTEVTSNVELPAVVGGRFTPESAPRRLVITVLQDGKLLHGSEPITREDLALMLRDKAPADGPNPLELRLRADHRVPYKEIEPILLECAAAGIRQLKFHVIPGAGK